MNGSRKKGYVRFLSRSCQNHEKLIWFYLSNYIPLMDNRFYGIVPFLVINEILASSRIYSGKQIYQQYDETDQNQDDRCIEKTDVSFRFTQQRGKNGQVGAIAKRLRKASFLSHPHVLYAIKITISYSCFS